MAFKNILDERKKSQGFVELKKQSNAQLKELLDRQEQLLANKAFISKLPDRGDKIQNFKNQISEELKKRDIVDNVTDLMSQIDLQQLPTNIEWHNKFNKPNELDSDGSDDENVNALKIFATHSGTMPTKMTKNNFSNPQECNDYSVRLCEKFDKVEKPATRFKPNEPKIKLEVVTGFKASAENVKKKLGKHWEVTAATTPIPVHGDTKMLTLVDSIDLQKAQAEKLKEIQLNEAIDRLKQSSVRNETNAPFSNFTKYRDPSHNNYDFEGNSTKKYPEEDGDSDSERGCAVFYNLTDGDPA